MRVGGGIGLGDSRYERLGIQRKGCIWIQIDQNAAYSRVYLPLGISVPEDGKDVSFGQRAKMDQILDRQYSRTGS